MSSRPPAVLAAVREPGLGQFDFTFEAVFRPAVLDLLRGMLPQPVSAGG